MTAAALKKCDIVMKGGITSGIVYPGVVCKLSEQYQFESIGGTSAGAIAAALTAAAEYARRHGRNAFAEVAEVPGWLGKNPEVGGGSHLFDLFQPQKKMKVLFRLATAFLVQGWSRRIFRGVKALWLELSLGLIPVFVFAHLAVPVGWVSTFIAILLGLFLVIAGILIAGTTGVLVRIGRLSTSHYGLCTGYTEEQRGQPPSLVAWLNEKMNTIANLDSGHPLTFGDLKGSGITLKMISTCLTFGRPYTLPFTSPEFYYLPAEMELFFPKEVVRWMNEHPAAVKPDHHHEEIDEKNFKRLPDENDLPVIVATRLSLSFPFLFCAVPLYAVDWSRRRRAEDEPTPDKRVPGDALAPKEMRVPEPAWFSDGGICSNFPLHLFDSPLPKWPTFGINLRDLRPDRTSRVWMPRSNSDGLTHLSRFFSTRYGIGAAGKFFFSMFDAARNWMDNLQSMVPGYRDRLVHIYLDKLEGGLNLNMPAPLVTKLSGYGTEAAEALIDHFVNGRDHGEVTPMTWDNHRWIRYRSTIALLEAFFENFAFSLENPEPGDRSFFQLINRAKLDPLESYKLSDDQRNYATVRTLEIEELGQSKGPLEAGAPKPTPALRIRPTF